jgi:polyhydroxyalkanoate synthesis regulator protein
MAKSEHRVTIKRYAGRRLYNAYTGTYVTPDEVAAMADDDEGIVVHDAGTGEDITQLILQQQRLH